MKKSYELEILKNEYHYHSTDVKKNTVVNRLREISVTDDGIIEIFKRTWKRKEYHHVFMLREGFVIVKLNNN